MEENRLIWNFVATKDQLIGIMTKFCEKNTFIGLRQRVTSFSREQNEMMIIN